MDSNPALRALQSSFNGTVASSSPRTADRSVPTTPSTEPPTYKSLCEGSLPSTMVEGRRAGVCLATVLSILLLFNSKPPTEDSKKLPVLHRMQAHVPEKYFIAANLYNNDETFDIWAHELVQLCGHLGIPNVFVSIAESNSKDRTKLLLHQFGRFLSQLEIPHRIHTEDNSDRWWPYGTAPERVRYLAEVRNKAMEPIQSDDSKVRLANYADFTRVVFINDIYFSWQSIVRLLATRVDGKEDQPADYDLACAIDYGISGLYDSWVARDACGTPMRPLWPYVADRTNIEALKQEKPFEVAACWNGVVAFPAAPYRYRQAQLHHKRGWRMMDDPSYNNSLSSPPLADPIKFRGVENTDPCDHSECFLFSYDLHRLYNGTRIPKIYMNPNVKVTYSQNLFNWHNKILEVPFVKLWLRYWSRGPPLYLINWILEPATRKRDYCTWGGLQLPDRCDPLPLAPKRGWEQG